MSDQRPFTYQFLIERWADGLKVLGAGNGAGLLASGASLRFFSPRPELLTAIKVGAAFFLVGLLLFAIAFLVLSILPLTIEIFLASSDRTFSVFRDMMTALCARNKKDERFYLAFVLSSLISFICFVAGCLFAVLHVILFI
jgi:hypothetical protein